MRVTDITKRNIIEEKGRVVIITGSTRGIGLELAKIFLKNNDKVTIFCRHKYHGLETLNNLEKHFSSQNFLITTGDVRKSSDVRRIINDTLNKFGKVDILINNASVATYKPIEETTEEDWNNIIDTNLKGYFLFIHHLGPYFKKQKKGIIINISSAQGERGSKFFSAYSASKFGIVGLSDVASEELEKENIKVYTVFLGPTNTQMHNEIFPNINKSKIMQPNLVANKIFKIARGQLKSGQKIKIYS
jgi:3-oxoacyl-[acyl-carrier protein] reductase